MSTLRALLFNSLFFGGTAILCFFMLPLLLLGQKGGQISGRLWCGWVQFLLRNLVGMYPRVRGQKNLPEKGCILVAKHQSAWETLTFHTLLPDPAYVLKKELLNIPMVGTFLKRSGQVAVDRSGGAAALKDMVKGVGKALERDAQVIIFPEGTRTPPGSDRPYHPGIYALYKAFPDTPMIPVAINSGMFWGKHSFMKYGGEVTLEYMEPMESGLDRKTFMREMKTRIDTRTRELERAAQTEFHLPAPKPEGVETNGNKGESEESKDKAAS